MKMDFFLILLAASLTLWGVDLRLQRSALLREQAQIERDTRRLEDELRRIRSEVQESLASPQLLMVFEEFGYHRSFRETRAFARALLEGENGSRVVQRDGDSREGEPLW